MSKPDQSDSLLAEQIAYYRAIAPEFENHAIRGPGEDELIAAIDAFQPTGDVLELACGPGTWTRSTRGGGVLRCLKAGARSG